MIIDIQIKKTFKFCNMVYLQDIKLSNFKCFEETQRLKLGKITLLTGANSTGKSSLMYSILGALQTHDFPLNLSPNGQYVQLGNFLEMVFKHDNQKALGISFTLVDTENERKLLVNTEWTCSNAENPLIDKCQCVSEYYNLEIKPSGDGKHVLYLDVHPEKNKNKMEVEDLLSYVNSKFPTDTELVKLLKYANLESHIHNHAFDDTVNAQEEIRYPLLFVMQDIQSLLKKYNASVNYISSYRQPAQRIYAEEPVASGKIATSGEGFINELLKWKDDDKRDRFQLFVDSMMSIGLLSGVEPTRLGSGQFKVGVRVHDDDEVVNLWDVGFGISQTMPIIIGDIELGDGSTLYISQPEVHLHPRAQAKFGDYLVQQMNKGKRYVIESHSEYLMNRLRLSVVKGLVDEEDIKVYYMSQGQGQTTIYDVRFKKNGQIEGAPQDFFDTYMIDVMDIAMNAE